MAGSRPTFAVASVLSIVCGIAPDLVGRAETRRVVVTSGAVAVRDRANSTTSIVISAESLEQLPSPRRLDELIALLPADRKVTPASLPDGWAIEQKGKRIRAWGPPTDRAYARLDLSGNYTKDYAGKSATLQSGLGGKFDEPLRITIPLWPRVDATPNLEGILTYPPAAAPGQPLLIGVSGPYRNGEWRISTDSGFAPLVPIERLRDMSLTDPAVPRALIGLRGTTEFTGLLGRAEPRPFITVFPDVGAFRRVTFTDRWGEVLVDATLVIVASPQGSGGVALAGSTPFVFAGQAACVGGVFPDLGALSLVMDGATQLELWGGSRTNVMVGVPANAAPGPHTIGPSDGSATVTVGVLTLQASLDQNKLWRGESTTMRLGVVGTDRPIPISVLNRTPGVIAIDGGAYQTVTTPGGADNAVSKNVQGTQRGDFTIDVRVNVPGCGR